MSLEINYKYIEGYLPTKRHKKLRYREVEDTMTVKINKVVKEESPIAFLVHEGIEENPIEYRLWNNKLWKPILWYERLSRAEGLYPYEEFIKSIEYHSYYKHNKTKEEAQKEKYNYVNRHLIVDGIVYGLTSEPRYVLMTFGLGNNHGGTSLMISNGYNSNISKDRYFNALQREEAIKEGKRVAKNRGDTNFIERIGQSYNIEVLIPEAVRCNPQQEHGEGCSFINKLENITNTQTNTNAKAFLAMGVLANELSELE